MDGFAVARACRLDAALRNVRLVATSDYSSVEDHAKSPCRRRADAACKIDAFGRRQPTKLRVDLGQQLRSFVKSIPVKQLFDSSQLFRHCLLQMLPACHEFGLVGRNARRERAKRAV
jgi:hypothetical protein